MVTRSQLTAAGVPAGIIEDILKGWATRQYLSYMRPNPRRYQSRSKYMPAGPNRNVPLTNR